MDKALTQFLFGLVWVNIAQLYFDLHHTTAGYVSAGTACVLIVTALVMAVTRRRDRRT